jgi:para-nitrobenzyl esterase
MFSQTRTVDAHKALAHLAFGDFADRVLQAYPAKTDKESVRAGRDLIRDMALGWGAWTWAHLQADHGRGPVYLYYFAHQPPWPNTPPMADWGAAHGSEISYVFGTLNPGFMQWTDRDRALSDQMMTYWTNFAKTGDPNGGGQPHWARFTTDKPNAMIFADKPVPGLLPNRDKMQLFDAFAASRRKADQGAP